MHFSKLQKEAKKMKEGKYRWTLDTSSREEGKTGYLFIKIVTESSELFSNIGKVRQHSTV